MRRHCEVPLRSCSLWCASPNWFANQFTSLSPNCSLFKDIGQPQGCGIWSGCTSGDLAARCFPCKTFGYTSTMRLKSRVDEVATEGKTETKPICCLQTLFLQHKIHANVSASRPAAQRSLWLLCGVEGFWPASVNTQPVSVLAKRGTHTWTDAMTSPPPAPSKSAM